jgi:hypothetical protein
VSQIYVSRQCPSIPGLGQIPGCTSSLALASFDASGNAGDKDSINPSLDAIGLAISFESLADNIAPTTRGNGFEQVYTRNTCPLLAFPGITLSCPNVVEAVSLDATGQLGTGDSISPATGFLATMVAYATRAPNILPPGTSNQQIVGTTPCVIERTLALSCGQPQTVVVSVDQNGAPGRADSSNPAIAEQKIGFTSLAGLLPGVSGRQTYLANACLVSASCTLSVALLSADANGNALGGDFVSMEGSGAFATFATLASSSPPETSEVFLGGPFF